jgi:hypothetical protein
MSCDPNDSADLASYRRAQIPFGIRTRGIRGNQFRGGCPRNATKCHEIHRQLTTVLPAGRRRPDEGRRAARGPTRPGGHRRSVDRDPRCTPSRSESRAPGRDVSRDGARRRPTRARGSAPVRGRCAIMSRPARRRARTAVSCHRATICDRALREGRRAAGRSEFCSGRRSPWPRGLVCAPSSPTAISASASSPPHGQARARQGAPHCGDEDVPEMGMTYWLEQAEAELK